MTIGSADQSKEFGFSEVLESGRTTDEYNRWMAEQFVPHLGQRVLEIGCGIGSLLEYWADREFAMGIDMEQACIEKCQDRFRDRPNVRVSRDAVGSPGWIQRWSEHRFDSVVAINLLEHIRDDLAALKGWRQIVEAGGGGQICVLVPAFEFAFSDFDRRYGHYRRYTKETLRDKLLDAGLNIEVLRYFNMPGLLAWWTMFVLLRKQNAEDAPVGLYSKLVVPLFRKIEAKFTPPFGNSVIAVCSVPAAGGAGKELVAAR
jgi:SAM-dependent methyltransferase